MKELTFAWKEINFVGLDEELRNALGEQIYGLNATNDTIIVYLADSVTPMQEGQAQTIVLEHDPTQLTPSQQIAIQQQQQLEQLRQANTSPIDLSLYDGETGHLRHLAQKIAWLEMEFRVKQEN